MTKLKTIILVLCLTISATLCFANNFCGDKTDGLPVAIIKASNHCGDDRSSCISVYIDGRCLSIIFIENLGQVAVEVSSVSGGEVETRVTITPSGFNIYIPENGRYVVTFTLPDGDEYYGEFEVTD